MHDLSSKRRGTFTTESTIIIIAKDRPHQGEIENQPIVGHHKGGFYDVMYMYIP